ncbi:AraC family transcriptional regulator [Chondrinema litorale]|uniref:AraC family transcriptional regulator n=1 Tax=Chondrinema litorale TaxID=2994555 RepID=UPI002543D2F8|nr:AraC family transcriptional regulator [Chondrinema litorale]UZR97405.1 helix-turn-helix transcriptional regulator [Chondrinema litorale]
MKGDIINIRSIAEVHQMLGIPKPKHPLITILYHSDVQLQAVYIGKTICMDLYMIGMKDGITGTFEYGRSSYDFNEGTMLFMSPNQVFTHRDIEIVNNSQAWTLVFHPDLIRTSDLVKHIDEYTFFSYDSNEALHISEDEKKSISDIAKKIAQEYNQKIDRYTQELIVVNLETMLKYCKRYYDRQFYTRTNLNKDYINKFERFLKTYFTSNKLIEFGLPTIAQCGEALNMSGHYLSDLLKTETGKSAKEHIHLYLIEKAKTILLSTNNSISQVAYDLGFEYPQHFSKLFKNKTGLSPSEYRNIN